jgi:hypothetical protein
LQDHTHAPISRGIFLEFGAIAQRSATGAGLSHPHAVHRHADAQPLRRQHPEGDPGAGTVAPTRAVLVAAQPTRGVDIGATEYIHQRLLDQRRQGTRRCSSPKTSTKFSPWPTASPCSTKGA